MMRSRRERPRFAVLLSGSGRSLENLHDCILRGDVDGQIVLVISNTPKAYGLVRAERLDIEHHTLRPRDYPDRQAWSDAVYRQLREHDVDWVLLLGFLALLPIAPDFEGRVPNIHPSLLPKHGGAGMYGNRVHAAVLEAGDLESGCTVHFCDDEYDRGTVLHQRRCPVHPNDDVESLAARVFEEEKRALPEALRKLARLHR